MKTDKNKTYHERYQQFYNSPAWQALRNYKFGQADGLCEKCKETATFNLQMQLKPICVTISRAVTMSHIAGYDERKISQMQREQIKRSDNNAE